MNIVIDMLAYCIWNSVCLSTITNMRQCCKWNLHSTNFTYLEPILRYNTF